MWTLGRSTALSKRRCPPGAVLKWPVNELREAQWSQDQSGLERPEIVLSDVAIHRKQMHAYGVNRCQTVSSCPIIAGI